MSESVNQLLRHLSDETSALAGRIVRSTALVTGQTKDFNEYSGSAWHYDAEHLVTNNHVVEDLVDPIRAQLPGAAPVDALIIGRDTLTDLAVLRVAPQTAAPLEISAEERASASCALPSAVRLARCLRASAWGS